jgi:hypothetical protein
MAVVVNPSWTDTTGGSTHEITLPSVNFGTDWRVLSQEPSRLVLTNLTTPLGYEETVTRERRLVNDMYSGTNVDKALYAATRKGVQFHQALKHVRRATSTEDPTFELALPSAANFTYSCVQSSLFTVAMAVEDIERAIACLYETRDTLLNGGVEALLRGSLKPKDL